MTILRTHTLTHTHTHTQHRRLESEWKRHTSSFHPASGDSKVPVLKVIAKPARHWSVLLLSGTCTCLIEGLIHLHISLVAVSLKDSHSYLSLSQSSFFLFLEEEWVLEGLNAHSAAMKGLVHPHPYNYRYLLKFPYSRWQFTFRSRTTIMLCTEISIPYYTILPYYDCWFSNYCGPK